MNLSLKIIIRKNRFQLRILLVGLVFITLLFLCIDKYNFVLSTQAELQQKTVDFTTKTNISNTINLINQQQTQEFKQLVNAAIPTRIPFIEVLSSLSSAANICSVKLSNIKVNSLGTGGKKFLPFEIQLSVVGSYDSIWFFMNKIVTLMPLVVVNDIQVSGETQANAQLKLRYSYSVSPNLKTSNFQAISQDDIDSLTKLQQYEHIAATTDEIPTSLQNSNRNIFEFDTGLTIVEPPKNTPNQN